MVFGEERIRDSDPESAFASAKPLTREYWWGFIPHVVVVFSPQPASVHRAIRSGISPTHHPLIGSFPDTDQRTLAARLCGRVFR